MTPDEEDLMHSYLSSLLALRDRADRGATAVEYGLMIVLLAVAAVGLVFLLGANLNPSFD
jgi:Flp pilus assembly pilin Flp